MRRILTWALWIILILAVIGVAFAAWRYLTGGSDPPAGEQVIMVCSNDCAERGQCGTTTGEPDILVVLGGKDSPVVEPEQHDIFFPAGASVEIKESMQVTLQEQDGRQFDQTFSRVEFRNPIGDIAEIGWVAEWCVERP